MSIFRNMYTFNIVEEVAHFRMHRNIVCGFTFDSCLPLRKISDENLTDGKLILYTL